MRTYTIFGVTAGVALAVGSPAFAAGPSGTELKGIADTLWVLVAAFLVFFMNTGFGCVEAGFCRVKNAVNILGKNFVVFAIASIAFWAIGWAIMFGDGNALLGTSGWFVAGADNSPHPVLATAVKGDVKDQFKFADDSQEESFWNGQGKLLATLGGDGDAKGEAIEVDAKASLGDQLDAVSEFVRTTVRDDKHTVSVKIERDGYPTFEKDYSTGDVYWGVYSSIEWAYIPLLAKFFFQLVFAGTAATIVSGCVAERIHYRSFMIFSVFIAGLFYPITGHWIWGGGWLGNMGFLDFAGSTVVHSVGGWAGLAGILFLGARRGKYRDGRTQPIPGHSMALAFLGGMILWLGWFGFNPGSTMAADPAGISHIVITTNLACAAGIVSATLLAWALLGKPDFSMTVNGALAGLVAITAPCYFVTPFWSIVIGLVGGALVVLAVPMFDRLRIDDPVGALSVHLVNGIWGTLALGLFASENGASGLLSGNVGFLTTQIIGIVAVGAFTFAVSAATWAILKATVGLRVDPEDEIAGLDVSEMGMEAYNGFQTFDPVEHAIAASEPREAWVPPNGEHRFTIVVSGAEADQLLHVWSELCQPEAEHSADFEAVYPYMTTVRGNRFSFRGGDPQAIRQHLESLFRDKLGSQVRAELESGTPAGASV